MKFMPALTFAALAIAVVAVVVATWASVANAPWEDGGGSAPVATAVVRVPPPTRPAGPQHTAVEIIDAVKTQQPDLCALEVVGTFFSLGNPIWNDARQVWTLSCTLISPESTSTICYEVDDETLEFRSDKIIEDYAPQRFGETAC